MVTLAAPVPIPPVGGSSVAAFKVVTYTRVLPDATCVSSVAANKVIANLKIASSRNPLIDGLRFRSDRLYMNERFNGHTEVSRNLSTCGFNTGQSIAERESGHNRICILKAHERSSNIPPLELPWKGIVVDKSESKPPYVYKLCDGCFAGVCSGRSVLD